jgi:glycine dehydrogenase subunit 2
MVVEEGMMIEPTETESKETLDEFVAAMYKIDDEVRENPELVLGAPHTTPVGRIDEVTAARQPNLRHKES